MLSKPFPYVLWNGGSPELWLLYMDKDGILTPFPDTGPEKFPDNWRAILLTMKDM